MHNEEDPLSKNELQGRLLGGDLLLLEWRMKKSKKLIFVSNRAPKDFGLEKKKVISIRASTDPRIDRSADKWKEGVLLYEPPGTGETLLARAIASNIDANFLKVVSSAIIDKYIGESARLIREIFNYARDHQMQLVDAISAREPMQTVKSKECSWNCSIIWMEILKIHAAGIDKHGEIDSEDAIKLDEGFNGADMVIFCTISGLHPLNSDWRPAEAALYCIRAISDYVSDIEVKVMPQIMSLLPKLAHQPQLLQTDSIISETVGDKSHLEYRVAEGDVLPKDGSDNKARMVDNDIDVANKESIVGRQVHEAFDNSTDDYKQLVENGVPNAANNHGSFQILCEYYQLKCPVRGSTIKFHPMDHLHPLEYYRPDEALLHVARSIIDLKSCRSSLKLAEIEDCLYQKDLHEPLTGVKPESMKEEDWKLKDRQDLGLIRLSLSRNVAFNIVKDKTISDLLKAL
ncbi:hypothetical protein CQW23_30044 [Capsicum baccatum]|uniref:ATPase AAA-type core domain-containing protein n=1 Tax=Capsicum baccatum TaxID=33114 RepID=A0A2G2VBL1_CAPBA|nr:hypothetical protein CQW23_30044 [Capsicum baccatum]